MTISLFLLLCLAAMLGLWLSAYLRGPERIFGFHKRQLILTGAWTGLGLLALWTINSYTYPANSQRFFPNTAYHVLEHQGFSFRDSLVLANSEQAAQALWDQKDGYLALPNTRQLQLRYRNFGEPIYVKGEEGYQLENGSYGQKVGQRMVFGGAGEKKTGSNFRLVLQIEEEADTVAYKVDFGGKEGARRSKFNRKLAKGYPLVDILRGVPGWEKYRPVVQRFEGTLLLRSSYGDPDSELYFFPGTASPDSIGFDPPRTGGVISLASGQRFFTGLGMDQGPKMYFESKGEGTALLYDFPARFRLDDALENDLFVCSNFSDVAQASVQGGFFYPLFREADNLHHINGGLKYEAGSAREALLIRVIDHQKTGNSRARMISGGNVFELYARDGKFKWRFKLADLRADAPIGAWHLRGFAIGFVLLVLFTLHFVGWKELKPFEPVLYVLIFAFLTVRIILQWRMSVFPPVEDVRPSEWAFLRSGRHFNVTVIVTLLFFGLRWLLVPGTPEWRERLLDQWERIRKPLTANPVFVWLRDGLESPVWHQVVIRQLAVFAGLLIVLSGLRALGLAQLERFINIGFPIAFFLYFEFLHFKFREDPREHHFLGIHPGSLFNTLLALGFLALADAGFSIIFLLFSLLWRFFRTFGRGGKKKRFRVEFGLSIAGIALLIGLVFFGDLLLGFIFSHSALFYWILVLPLGGLFTWYFTGVVLRDLAKENILLRYAPMLGMIALLALASPLGINKIQDLGYVKYRAAIQRQNLDEIITNEQFDSGEIGQILRAAQNQWFINNYLRTPYGEEGGAFQLRSHFNKGSSYTTQTTDLVVTRYVIAEHGPMVLFFLVALLIGLAVVFLLSFPLSTSQLLPAFGALLLLVAIAFFIWLTATNRFIFFGQDFPLISLTSLFTLVFSLGLLLFALLRSQEEKAKRFKLDRWRTALPVLCLLIPGFLLTRSPGTIDDKNFDFNLSLQNARADFDQLDEDFTAFQDTFQAEVSVDSMVKAFYKSLPDSLVTSYPFSQSALEHFVKEQEVKTDPAELIHLVNRNGRYRFALNRSYYLIRPPQRQRAEWRGNLYAADEGGGAYLVDLGDRSRRYRIPQDTLLPNYEGRVNSDLQNVGLAVIPASWTRDQNPAVLLWALSGEEGKAAFTLSNTRLGGNRSDQDFADPAIRLLQDDFISVATEKGQLRYQYLENFRYFLAKNIWLNGRQRLFYPLGDRLLWAYYYANAVNSAISGTEDLGQDVAVSIDYALTDALSSRVERHFRDNKWDRQRFGVVALNGHGQLRLLLDHADERIDPNDIREFSEKNREYYLRNNTRLERETFGNINLLKLPNGPGSTLKPIMYAAATSQYNLGWQSLVMEDPGSDVLAVARDPEGEKMLWWGGKNVNVGWGDIRPEEFYRTTPQRYIVGSINMYHAALMYLGSFEKKELAQGLDYKIFLRPRSDSLELNFPRLSFRDVSYRINPKAWPRSKAGSSTYFGNTSSILALGLYDNFGLPTYRVRDRYPETYVDFDPPGTNILDQSRRGFVLYGYPEMPSFYQERRASQGLWFIRGLKQVSLGADPIRVTPLKMAEMAGKLYKFDQNFEVTLADSISPAATTSFDADPSWNGKYLDFVQTYIYGSMRDVVLQGTAVALQQRLKRLGGKYFYYAKTGTTGNSEDEESLGDKLLMLVISKGDVRTMSPEELRDNRFYIVFMTAWEMDVPEARLRWDLFYDVVREIESSYLFQSYMNGETEAQ